MLQGNLQGSGSELSELRQYLVAQLLQTGMRVDTAPARACWTASCTSSVVGSPGTEKIA